MGRSKNKNKLQLKYQNNNNNNNIISNSKIKDDESLMGGNESDDSENVLNNPILLNHINDIQNVNENILLWNDDDVIDDNKSKVFHQMVKSEIIKKSIKKSAFSKYLKSNLKEISKINIFALSGLIMKSDDSSDKSNVILNEISSNNYSSIESKKQSIENLNILDLPEEIENVDTSSQQLKLSEVATSLNDRPVRRSGRSAKINYKEMLNVQIFEVVRPSELQHNEGISSPKKKNRIKREISKRLSVNELEDNNNTVNEENDKTVKKGVYLTKEELESELEKEEKKEVFNNECDKVGAAELCGNELVDCSSSAKEQKMVGSDMTDEEWEYIDEPHNEAMKRKKMKEKRLIKKKYSKDLSRQCVLCKKPVMGSKRYLNLCYKCMVASSKLIFRMGLNANENGKLLVCLDIPPCFERRSRRIGGDSELCDACQVQRLIEKGVEWGPDFRFMRSLCLEQLRSADAVAKSRLASQKQIESWLLAFQGAINSNKSCILRKNKPLSSPCKWDIRYFQLQSSGKMCDLCKAGPTETSNHFYAILPSHKQIICHRCLVTAHNAYTSSHGPDRNPPCSPPCSDLQQCPSCLLSRIATFCPLDSIKYRYYTRTNNSVHLCEICMRKDSSLITVIRGGNQVCYICIGRVKLFHFKQMSPCEQGTCSIGQCDGCLVDLAQRVVDVHQIISHFHKYEVNSLLSPLPLTPPPLPPLSRKTGKRSIDHGDDVPETKCKRPCTVVSSTVVSNVNDTPTSPPATEDHRPRRIIKSTQFNDFIVDKSLLRKTIDRPARNSLTTTGYHRKSVVENEGEAASNKFEQTDTAIDQQYASKQDDNSKIMGNEIKEDSVVDDGNDNDVDNNADEKEVEKEDKHENAMEKSESVVENNYESSVEDKPAILEENIEKNDEKAAVITAVTEEFEEVVNEELSMKPCRRIKQAMPTVHANNKSADQQQPQSNQGGISATSSAIGPETTAVATVSTTAVIPRTNGPRVKQVSRQNVNADLNLDNTRQKCVIKRGNRVIKKPESMSSYIMDYEDRSGRRIIEDDTDDEEKDTRSESKDPEVLQFHAEKSISFNNETTHWNSNDMKCGICSGCARNRCCGKCDPCLLNKSQRRKTEICVKMVCSHYRGLLSNRHNGQSQSTDTHTSSYKMATIQSLDSSTDNADKSVDDIVPPDSVHQINGNKDIYVSEVYRDSDSDDLSSEEEQLDPELDSIHTVKGDLITTGLAHEGGFPVITSVKAQPNKILCFSCGSGGDQMIHCVSCAEPFHFFCIEYQFRPKSKEMFVCRNCTKCHTCQTYGSDLKCIKCQLGFHPRCVMKYPPSKSEDRSNWACYKCAMCLHCGAKAEDMMNQINKNDYHIDWSKDPWQCGRCARARKEGHVCPECGRAYQSGLETLECGSCARMVHRQCSGLTEDEYEIFKCDPEANLELSNFTCSKCGPEIETDDQKQRIRLKRQCKESNLKKYCERGVSRKMNELINKGETHEEMLLEQHNLSDVMGGHNRCTISNNQYDGVDDEFDKSVLCDSGIMMSLKEYDTVTIGSPSVAENYDREINQANSTMFYSSESTGECDMEPLNIMDLESTGKEVDIDVSLETVLPTRTKIGIFSRLNASDFISPKHLIMEALARISVKLSRYSIHSQIHKIYDKFLIYIQDLNDQIFPWVDFSNCFETVQAIVKKYAGRVKLMMQSITDNVRESRNREFDVFSSSISEIEEKLSNSFQRGREEFIIFHSEQHLIALKKSMECRSSSSITANKDLYTNYKLAFRTEFNTATCEKDVRICALCGFSGDDGLEGRLIYGGLDVWVHVNCALWSDDVYEKEDGALVNVDLAIKQGESSICSSCNKVGATVRCSANDSLIDFGKSCSNIYHFACAFNSLPYAVFTESRSFYCSTSHKSYDTSVEVLSLEDMPILRRIYLPQGCLGGVSMACSDGISSDEIVVTIGNLRINCLGKIDSCSDMHKIYLCPLEYQARRLYWSMYELDSLVMYSMSIQKEINVNKLTDGVSSVVTMPVSNPNPIPHRRRMIEMPEHRVAKRPKAMSGEHDIIYEMDDAGNLQPISGSVMKMKPPSFSNFQYPEAINRKVNRRFPMNYSKPNRTVESKKDIDRFPTNKAPLTTSLPSTSCNHSNVKLNDHRLQTNNDQSLLTTRSPIQIPRKGVESPAVLPQQVISQSVALPVKQMKPMVLQLNQGSSNMQQRNLPQSILNQLKLNKNTPKPLTFINVTQPINNLSSMNPATITSSKTVGNKLLKLVKIQDDRRVQGNLITSSNQLRVHQQASTTNFHPQTVRIVPSSHAQSIHNSNNSNVSRVGTLPSVLRTALTDNSNQSNNLYHHNHPFVQQRPQITSVASSSYHISACGSLLTPTTFLQYDGEADDASVLAADDMQITNISESICGYSDQDNASTVTANRIRMTNKSNKSPYSTNRYSLKFVIHGFKESKTPKACWSYLARKISQMRKMEGLDEYDLKIGDGWSKFGLDHRHVIYLIEQMVGAFQCSNYDFKFHKSRANLLRQQCLPVIPSTNGCARFSPWISTKPEHFATDPLAFLLSKSNLPPKNHAPASADQNDDNPEPDEDYLQTLASQFRNLQNGVQSREKNVRVCCSNIHGRGLFARRQFDAHEIIIEYVGEVIRSVLSDVRETEYQRTGVDCYMFRLDHDFIVDATCKGNAARFINHSCHPNCYAKVVRFEGEKHIIIIAQRQIYKGEELTYDYRFPIEDDKLPCTCGSFSCKKYLN